jgi:hypothetical protein
MRRFWLSRPRKTSISQRCLICSIAHGENWIGAPFSSRGLKSADVWVRRPVLSAEQVDHRDALHVSAPHRKVFWHRITDDPLGGRAVQPHEAFRGAVVDRQDEAKVGRPSQRTRVFGERSLYRLFVASEGLVALLDTEGCSRPSPACSRSSRCEM